MHNNTHTYNFLLNNKLIYPSIRLLDQQIHAHAKQTKRRFSLPNSGSDLLWEKASTFDVALYGDALMFPPKIINWPRKNFRLWFLSRAMRKIFAHVCALPESDFGLLARHSLFPRSPSPTPLPSLQGACEFVFAGQLSRYKSAEQLGIFLREIKSKGGTPRLHICGANQIPKGLELLKKAARDTEVIDHGDLGIDWTKQFSQRSTYISLSLAPSEDFGVSLAQAQQAGLPVIVSDWGGHRDARGENVYTISHRAIEAKHHMLSTLTKAASAPLEEEAPGRVFSWSELSLISEEMLKTYSLFELNYANSRLLSPKIKRLLLSCFSDPDR
jgi:glycosyltransferase involved in cell wall biosynthesis